MNPQEGFWQAASQDVAGLAKAAVTPPVVGAAQQLYEGVKGAPERFRLGVEQGTTPERLEYQRRISEGYTPLYAGGFAPVGEAAGVNVQQMEQNAALGDTAGVLGRAAVPTALATAPLTAKPARAALRGTAAKVPTVREVALNLQGSKGPRVGTPGLPKEAAGLPQAALDGAEGVIKAAAPTGTNQGFAANVYAAAGDLAEIGRKIDLSASKGGVRRPDLRPAAFVEAADAHLAEMYATERAPQIKRHANAPVKVRLGPDAEMGLQYLKRSAGSLPDVEATTLRSIAAKASETGVVPLAEADQLARVANQHLKNFESMTGAQKTEALSKTPKLAGLKALDVGLGKNVNTVLTELGERGVRSYERRYAGVSEVRDGVASRVNAVRLDVSKAKVVRPLLSLFRGKSGIASASQAAVADVNIGRTLQFGLKKLAASGIKARR